MDQAGGAERVRSSAANSLRVSVSVRQTTMARSAAFSSSRTLPGQS
jgi:hypothetical protein